MTLKRTKLSKQPNKITPLSCVDSNLSRNSMTVKYSNKRYKNRIRTQYVGTKSGYRDCYNRRSLSLFLLLLPTVYKAYCLFFFTSLPLSNPWEDPSFLGLPVLLRPAGNLNRRIFLLFQVFNLFLAWSSSLNQSCSEATLWVCEL